MRLAISLLVFSTLAIETNAQVNVQAFGVVGDGGLTNNQPGIKAAIESLGANGGSVYFPTAPAAYSFDTTIVVPRNVIIECSAPDAVTLRYTGSGAAFVWADPGADTAYNRGGMRDCRLSGPGATSSAVGIFSGGGFPVGSGTIVPASWRGDFLTFFNDKITDFNIGYETGNHTWENNFISTLFTNNSVGWKINPGVENGENIAMHGGAIQNGITAIINNNVNADLVFHGISIDAITGAAVLSGDSSIDGGTVELVDPHIEYFGNPSTPVFQVWGQGPFSMIKVRDGVIQFNQTAASAESLVKMCSTATCQPFTGNPHTAGFILSGTQIRGSASLTWSGACSISSPGICIEGDNTVQDAVIEPYSFWSGGSFGSPGGTQVLPGLQNLIQYSGVSGGYLSPPTCKQASPQRNVCAVDAVSCGVNNQYVPFGSNRCTLTCAGNAGWRTTGIGC